MSNAPICSDFGVGRAGFEPATLGLKSERRGCGLLLLMESSCKERDPTLRLIAANCGSRKRARTPIGTLTRCLGRQRLTRPRLLQGKHHSQAIRGANVGTGFTM
jgi:hypothetical protein